MEILDPLPDLECLFVQTQDNKNKFSVSGILFLSILTLSSQIQFLQKIKLNFYINSLLTFLSRKKMLFVKHRFSRKYQPVMMLQFLWADLTCSKRSTFYRVSFLNCKLKPTCKSSEQTWKSSNEVRHSIVTQRNPGWDA